MIPVINPKGSSFRGASRYYFHDKLADGAQANGTYASAALKPQTMDRVEFYETRNLAHTDWELATDEMWYTAERQNDLKRAAGLKPGQLCKDPVQTVSLSWHPEQDPTREEIVAAADGFTKRMGLAEAQALYVVHNDTPHAHIHIIYNRVHPETGRTFSDSFEHARATSWAQDYMYAQGRVYWEPKPANENSRQLPHNVIDIAKPHERRFETADAALADRPIPANDNLAGERTLAAALAAERQALKDAQKAEREAYFKAGKEIFRTERQAAYQDVRDAFRPQWKAYYEHRSADENMAIDQVRAAETALVQALNQGSATDALQRLEAATDHLSAVIDHYKLFKTELLHDQKLATQVAQREAVDCLMVERKAAYDTLLEHQQFARDGMRAAHAQDQSFAVAEPAFDAWTRPLPDRNQPIVVEREPAPLTFQHPLHEASTLLHEDRLADGRATLSRDPLSTPSRLDITDAGAGAIGAAANYLADQLGEFLAPSSPQELAARGRAAEAAKSAQAEARNRAADLHLKHVNAAIGYVEAQRERHAHDQDYWHDRERRRDR